MPRGKKIAHQTKYEVLSCILQHLPQRTQARFKAVSKDVKAMLPDSIKPPSYAQLLDELQATVRSLPRGSRQVTFMDGTEFGLDVKYVGLKVRIEVGKTDQLKWKLVSTCKPGNIKKVLYRAAAKGKSVKLKGIGPYMVSEVLEHVASTGGSVQDYMPVPPVGQI